MSRNPVACQAPSQPNDGRSGKNSENSSTLSSPCVVPIPWPFPKKLIKCEPFRPLKGKAACKALFEEEGDPPW